MNLKYLLFAFVFILAFGLIFQISNSDRVMIIPFNARYGLKYVNRLNDTFMVNHGTRNDSIRESFYLIEGSINLDTGTIKEFIVHFIDTSQNFYKIFSPTIRSQTWFYKTSKVTNRNFIENEDNSIPEDDKIAELSYYSPDNCTLDITLGAKLFIYSLTIDNLTHKILSVKYWQSQN